VYRHVFLMGPMGAGKSTTARYLCEQHGYTRYALATQVNAVLDIAAPWLKGASKAVRRPYLQKVGRFLREFQPNPLLFAAEERLRTAAGPLVIDDGRTLEEAVWAHQHRFIVIVLTAAKDVRERRVLRRDGELPDARTFEDETEQAWRSARGYVIDTTDMNVETMCDAVWRYIQQTDDEDGKSQGTADVGEGQGMRHMDVLSRQYEASLRQMERLHRRAVETASHDTRVLASMMASLRYAVALLKDQPSMVQQT
jgi:hypothetical protein